MRDLGKFWNDCHTGKILEGRWEYQRKIVIGNVTFEDNNLVDVNFSRGLMAKSISFGNTIAASLSAIIIPHTDQVVYRNSKVTYYVRVIDLHDNVSPWAKFGEFYVDKVEKEFDKYRIECFDIMYLSEDRFPQGNYTAKQAVSMIASELGVSVVNPGSFSDFDMNIKQNFTHREILGFIASMNIGNFFINEEGNLKFTKLTISSPVQSILPSNTKKIVGSESIKFDKVTVKYGSGQDEKLVAGSGNSEFEIFNPFADSQMANRLLNFFNNYTFYPGDMSSTGIDPAIELGDTINVDGLKVNLINVSYSVRMYASVDIPYETNKLQDVFYFEAAESKDYDEEIEDHEDRITAIEDLMNLGDCLIIKKNMLKHVNRYAPNALVPSDYPNECFTISKEIDNMQIHAAENKHIRLIGGGNINSASSLIHNTNVPDMRDFMISKDTMDFYRAFYSCKYVDSSMWGKMGQGNQLSSTKSAWFKGKDFGDFSMFDDIKFANELFGGFDLYTTRDYSIKIDISNADASPLDQLFNIRNYSSINKERTKINADLSGVIGLNSSNQSFRAALGGMYLNKLILPNDSFRYANVNYLFSQSTIDNLDFSKLNFSSARSLDGVFSESNINKGIYDLRNVKMTDSLESMNSMFSNSKAKEITFNEDLEPYGVNEMIETFSGCEDLVTVKLPNITLEGRLDGEKAPYRHNVKDILNNCKYLETQIFDDIYPDDMYWTYGNLLMLGNIDNLDLGGVLRIKNFTGVATTWYNGKADPNIFSRSKIRKVIVSRATLLGELNNMNSYFNDVTFERESK